MDPENPAIRDLMQEIRVRDRERKKLPVGNPKDGNYRRLLFCRYADDVLLGVIGSLQESREILQAVGHYLKHALNLELAEEKSHVVQASKGTTFLGYQVTTYRDEGVLKKVKRRDSTFYTFKRILPDCIWLTVPQEKVVAFCSKRGYGDWGTFRPQHRSGLLQRSDTEIVLLYNAEIRGFLNYYQLAHRVKSGPVRKLWFMWRSSLFSTLASKHRTQKAKIARKLQQGHKYVHMSEIKGKPRRLEIYNIREFQRNRGRPIPYQGDLIAGMNWARLSRTEITQRLNADTCEYCGKIGGYFEVHHVKKLKDITGKELWKRTMISMKRKTLVLCVECHEQLHKGTLPSWKRQKA
jgi:RNA-directed DNA polymerase